MEWLLKGDRFHARSAEYQVGPRIVSQHCIHWCEPRPRRRSHFGLDSTVLKTESVTPWLDAAETVLATAWGLAPVHEAHGIATDQQLEELRPYRLGGDYTQASEANLPLRYELLVPVTGKADGYLKLVLVRSGELWKLEAIGPE